MLARIATVIAAGVVACSAALFVVSGVAYPEPPVRTVQLDTAPVAPDAAADIAEWLSLNGLSQ